MMFKKIIFPILFLAFSIPLFSQYQIGHQSFSYLDPARSNRDVWGEVYYPADVAGDNVDLANGEFPLVVFGHGFVVLWSEYSIWWETLVAEGYIVAFPRTEGNISPSHENFGKDLAFLTHAFMDSNDDPNSIFFEHLSGRNAVMGHSMGGGCSFLAAGDYGANVETMISLAAATNTNPSAITAAANITLPTLTIAGSEDCVVQSGGTPLDGYNALPTSNYHAYVEITGASHCQFGIASAFSNCTNGELFCGGFMPIADQHTQMFLSALPWLDYHLKSDCPRWDDFKNHLYNTNNTHTYQEKGNDPFPVAVIDAPTTEFGGGVTSITLDASASNGDLYFWSTGETTSSITINAGDITLPTSFTVVVMDAETQCLSSPTTIIISPAVPIYVDLNAIGANDGSSWTDAFTDLQDALAIGADTDIYVAQGTYYPTSTTTRGISFEIPSGATLEGGYPTGGGTRDPMANPTILSGDIDLNPNDISNDSYHVVSVRDVTDVVMDGFIIRDGNADDASSFGRSRGGGVYVKGSTFTLRNSEVKWNKAVFGGGGLFATLSNQVQIEDCLIKKNRADYGSALYHSNETNMYIIRTKIIDNNSLVRAAVEVNNSSYTRFDNSLVANNASTNSNAIAFVSTNRDGFYEIMNSTILGETKDKYLITMQIGFNDVMDLNIFNSIVAHQDLSFLKNVRAYNNGVLNLNTLNCYVQGSSIIGTSSNNLYSDVAGDLMLNADYSVNECSPVVDAGDNASSLGAIDIDGNPRINGTVDMGAFEATTSCSGMRSAQAEKIGVEVYPNPVQETLFIQTDTESEIYIYIFDILGKQIRVTQEKEINLESVTNGIYWIKIMSGGEIIHTEKIVKS